MVTFDKKGNPIIATEAVIPYQAVLGPSWYKFFEGFKDEKIWGSKCPKCGRVLVPIRAFCPRCFVDIDDCLEVSSEGKIVAWVYVNYKYFGMPTKPPFISSIIHLDGVDSNFLHLIGGFDLSDLETVRQTVQVGTRVKAVWKKEKAGNIRDIEYFEPV